mmetsp:Transcript_6/g.11  ORF Transcript_6/g.11 Transcript_6/m.11 type:complete len:87 (+) Transcript_6:47-307(+)
MGLAEKLAWKEFQRVVCCKKSNPATSALAAAGIKNKTPKANESLSDGLVDESEYDKRQAEREAEFERKKQERAERKAKLTNKWAKG